MKFSIVFTNVVLFASFVGPTHGGPLLCSNVSSDKTSSSFSEEDGGLSVDTRGPISRVSCYGSYCDNKTLKYKELPASDIDQSNGSWTDWFSEEKRSEGKNKQICPKDEFVVQMQCSGDHCDNMRLKCEKFASGGYYAFKTNKDYDFITRSFSEERQSLGENYGDCGSDAAVVGVECVEGSDCDDINLYCRKWGFKELASVKCNDHYHPDAIYLVSYQEDETILRQYPNSEIFKSWDLQENYCHANCDGVPIGTSMNFNPDYCWDFDTYNGQNQHTCAIGGYVRLPSSFTKCPLSMTIKKEECKTAGLEVGGKLRSTGEVAEKWMTGAATECSIYHGSDNIHFNTNPNSVNTGGEFSPVCKVQSFVSLLPKLTSCPPKYIVSKEDCAAVALSAGAKLRSTGEVAEKWMTGAATGCSIYHGSGNIHFNTNTNAVNTGDFSPVCHKLPFIKFNSAPKCPLDSAVSEDDCIVAGLSLGIIDNGDVTLEKGSWSNRPSGCIHSVNENNAIQYNTNPNGLRNNDYNLVCQEIESDEYLVLSPPEFDTKCPSSIEVKKEDCEEAGLALGGTLHNGAVAEENWNNAPGGCIFGPNILYNKNADGVSDGLWHSICHKMKGVVQVPVNVHIHACPQDKTVSENDCLTAGLTAGAYKNGVIQGSWNDKPSGCFIDKIGSRSIYFNHRTNPDQLSKNDDISLLCQWECPKPHSTQHEQSFGCQCKDGYVSRATGKQLLQDDDDECISSLISTHIPVTSTTIAVKSKIISKMNNITVTQKASPNDIPLILNDNRFSTSTNLDNDGIVRYEHTFSGLEPGHRYNIRFTYTGTDGDETEMFFPAVTSCSCTNESDKTGPPKSFSTFQDNGHVMFSYEDNSYCEEAYSFTRRSNSDAEAVSFTRDYFFIPKVRCGSKIEPLTEASDNLVKSKLVVGENYEYCVRAIHPVLYMDHPFDHDDNGRTLLSSTDTCVSHKIQWEASILGKITTEVNAGRLPIKDVAVSYQLLNDFDMSPIAGCDGCSGTVLTKEGGSFDIAFNLDHDVFKGKNDVEFPVKLRFSKETLGSNNEIIHHKFLCNGGEDDCSDDIGTIIYLSHLQFKEPIQVYDDTSVPFSGKVFVENTRFPGSLGCPISNVEVCLIQERNAGIAKTNETLVCGNTEPDGSYSLPVIIGSQVHYVELVYDGHSFEPSADSSFTPGVGVTIEAGKYYGDNDFMDVEKARLMVDVVGGLCDKFLGTSTVQAKIVGCEWEGMTYTQSGARGIYNNIPAHLLDVQVIDIKDTSSEPHKRYDHIWEYFQGDQPLVRTIDLRSTSTADETLKDEEDSLEETNTTKGLEDQDKVKKDEANNVLALEKEEEEKLELVRFQFDGELKMSVHISGDSLSCGNYSVDDTDSFHVLEYMKSFTSTVELKYELIKEKDLYCDVVDSEKMKLHVVNQVGIDENEGFDEFLSKLPERTTKLLELCKEGCLQDIVHDEDNEGKLSNAHVVEVFATGRPNIAHPYTKRMIFSVQGSASDVTHTASIIVEGYYSKGPGRSFALPTHKPIMILRDPPGGLSYASYENIETRFKLETSSTSTSMHNKFGVGIKMVVEQDPEMCLGAGGGLAGPSFATCKKVASVDNETPLGDIGTQFGGLVQMDNKEKSNEYSTIWSYQTSSDPMLAGSMSDVFIVPNLNVMYEEVYVVDWNNSTCSVTTNPDDNTLPTTTTFDLESGESAISFYTKYHIQYVKLPELQKSLSAKKKQKLDCECTDEDGNKQCAYKQVDNTDGSIGCGELVAQIQVLEEAIDEWKEALVDEKVESIKKGTKSILGWFDTIGQMGVDNSLAIDDQSSGIAPPTLSNNAKWVDARAEEEEKEQQRWEDQNRSMQDECKRDCELESSLSNSHHVSNDFPETPVSICKSGCEDDYMKRKEERRKQQEEEKKHPIETARRIQFSGGGNTFSMTLHKQKVWNSVGLSCWYGCNIEKDSTLKNEPFIATKAFGTGTEADLTIIDLNVHVSHQSTKENKSTESTSIGFTLGDSDRGDEFVVDLYYDDTFGTIVFDTVAGQSKCPHESGTAAVEDPSLLISNYPPKHVFPEEDMVYELEIKNLGVGNYSGFMMYAQHRDNDGGLELLLDGAPLGESRDIRILNKDTTYTKTLVVRRGPRSYQYPALDLVLRSTCDWKKSVTQTLHNVLDDNSSKLIKFIEPCPKVEWGGELKRDRSFVVNTLSHDTENLQISVFNPNHGDKPFQQMVEQDRLQKVLLYYRELGQLHWSVARTEIEKESGELSSEETDFAATYADETSYGYIKMKWALANIVPEGVYEIRVETQCDPLGGPDDIDMFGTTLLSGTIDLTPPEQYGQALPFKKSVLIGEEIVVVFSEPILCEKPFTFDLQVKIEGTDYIFDKEELQVVCEGRKIGFQIDPTVGIDVESVLGKSFSVEIGKVGADSLSNIFDINGNPIDDNIRVEKSFADIDLNQASTYFTFTKSDVECSNFTDSEMKTEVMNLLALDASDEERIQVGPVKCIGDNAVESKITIVPPAGKRRGLRLFSSEYSISQHEQNHSVKLFETLRDISTQNEPKHKERHLLAKHDHYLSFSVSNMKILPSSSDVDKMMKTIDPDLVDEEKELYHIATHAHAFTEQKTDGKKIVNEIKAHDEEIFKKFQKDHESEIYRLMQAANEREEKMSNELKTMTMELLVVTVACISVSLVTLFHVYRK